MIATGIILLLIGFVTKIAIVWTIGIIVLVLGLIAVLLGSTGHATSGRRHYWRGSRTMRARARRR